MRPPKQARKSFTVDFRPLGSFVQSPSDLGSLARTRPLRGAFASIRVKDNEGRADRPVEVLRNIRPASRPVIQVLIWPQIHGPVSIPVC